MATVPARHGTRHGRAVSTRHCSVPRRAAVPAVPCRAVPRAEAPTQTRHMGRLTVPCRPCATAILAVSCRPRHAKTLHTNHTCIISVFTEIFKFSYQKELMCNADAASLKTFVSKTHPCEKPYKGKEYSTSQLNHRFIVQYHKCLMFFYPITSANISGNWQIEFTKTKGSSRFYPITKGQHSNSNRSCFIASCSL
jgi:hypothetical protein